MRKRIRVRLFFIDALTPSFEIVAILSGLAEPAVAVKWVEAAQELWEPHAKEVAEVRDWKSRYCSTQRNDGRVASHLTTLRWKVVEVAGWGAEVALFPEVEEGISASFQCLKMSSLQS